MKVGERRKIKIQVINFTYIYTYIYADICTWPHLLSACLPVCVCVCVCVCMRVCMCVHIHIHITYICAHSHTYVHTYIQAIYCSHNGGSSLHAKRKEIKGFTYVCICLCMYVYTCVHMYRHARASARRLHTARPCSASSTARRSNSTNHHTSWNEL